MKMNISIVTCHIGEIGWAISGFLLFKVRSIKIYHKFTEKKNLLRILKINQKEKKLNRKNLRKT